MLFNSPVFLFLFLPFTLGGYYLFGRFGRDASIAFLVAMSLFFYGWWNPVYLGLLGFSIFFNFVIGNRLALIRRRMHGSTQFDTALGRPLLIFGVAVNLSLIGYFKYWNFFIDSFNSVFELGWNFEAIILPLAISFFTFQQITYLVDSYRGVTGKVRLLDYALFVTFFPQLIAGPIVHHSEMMPQFRRTCLSRFSSDHIAIGTTIFIIGLFKKVVIADGIANYSTPVFDAALTGSEISFLEAWVGTLAYAFQLYFDFSGYSDMAIGLARMFGIRLPLNFNSPYKSASIIEFWRRWHMTLSRFLRDYVYISLGGNRQGALLRYRNLMLTMLLGGLWHGAGWNFVLWGGLHGVFLVINSLWNQLWKKKDTNLNRVSFGRSLAVLFTFFCVIVAWIPFRSESFGATWRIFKGLFGYNGISLPESYYNYLGSFADYLSKLGVNFDLDSPLFLGGGQIGALLLLFCVVMFVPNTQQFMNSYWPAIRQTPTYLKFPWRWRPTAWRAVYVAILACASALSLNRVSEFLYFQF